MEKSPFQFTEPHIVNLEFHINEEFDQTKFEGFEIFNEVSNAIIEENQEAFVRLSITIGKKENATPFTCKIDMVAKFKMEQKCSSEVFEKLINVNAPALLLSYARPTISIITAQAGFPSFNMPFVNFIGEVHAK